MNIQSIKKRLLDLLSETRHIWVFGAGVGVKANLPLMSELTKLVPETDFLDEEQIEIYSEILESLKENSNVEDLLSYIIDLKQLLERKKNNTFEIKDGKEINIDKLNKLHNSVRKAIREIINTGIKREEDEDGCIQTYLPDEGENTIDLQTHRDFVNALWKYRGGLEERRSPVPFFTLNYDSLLENALSMEGISYVDGFVGSRTAYWDPDNFGMIYLDPFKKTDRDVQAKIYKLHGSIDWNLNMQESDNRIMRLGSEFFDSDPSRPSLIYPDSTKYELFKSEPFARVFDSFRNCLNCSREKLLISIGYSWGDEHVNKEVERAFKNMTNNINLLIFLKEQKDQEGNYFLSNYILRLLKKSNEVSDNSIQVVSDQAYYKDSVEAKFKFDEDKELWKFSGLLDLIKGGPN